MSSSTEADPRPLSPHLQIWRWHATMAASIFHRLTGMGLYVGSILFAAWIVSAAMGAQAYETVSGLIFSIPGQVLLFLWTLAVTFHFANGIRHLVWDGPGIGFAPKTASVVSVFNFAFSLIATLGIWAFACFAG